MSTHRDRPRLARAGPPAGGPPPAWPGAVVGAALGGVVGAASLLVPVDPPPVRPAQSTVPGALPDSSTPPTSVAGVGAGAPSAAASNAAASATAAADDNEADYLARATAQIGSAPAEALALAEAHPSRFPGGKLGQEREMIAISALAALGRKPEARARARLFLTLFPESTHRPRIEELVPELAEPKKAPDSAPAP